MPSFTGYMLEAAGGLANAGLVEFGTDYIVAQSPKNGSCESKVAASPICRDVNLAPLARCPDLRAEEELRRGEHVVFLMAQRANLSSINPSVTEIGHIYVRIHMRCTGKSCEMLGIA